jgi:hypothetical protein
MPETVNCNFEEFSELVTRIFQEARPSGHSAFTLRRGCGLKAPKDRAPGHHGALRFGF